MPPRKKPRLSPNPPSTEIPASSPTATPIAASPTHTPAQPLSASADTAPTYWSTTQQTALFKALIADKPTGPHKHMKMLPLTQRLQSSLGYHVPTSQVWAKLRELYDLKALDERETAYILGRTDSNGDWAEVVRSEFALPGEPRRHGVSGGKEAEEEGEAVDEERIREAYGARDAEEAWFVDEVWRRRFAADDEEEDEEEEDDRDELGEETTSPAPSTVASGRRKGRTRGARKSGRGASSTPMKEENDEGEEDEEGNEGEGTENSKATRSTRSSARTTKKGKKG